MNEHTFGSCMRQLREKIIIDLYDAFMHVLKEKKCPSPHNVGGDALLIE